MEWEMVNCCLEDVVEGILYEYFESRKKTRLIRKCANKRVGLKHPKLRKRKHGGIYEVQLTSQVTVSSVQQGRVGKMAAND